MMLKRKRILFFLVVFILFRMSSFSQVVIEEEYRKLVDYVNCYYSNEYFNINKSVIKTKDIESYRKYTDAFKNQVNKYSDIEKGFVKNVANSTSIYKTLQNLSSWYTNAKILWLYIDNKKEKFDSNWTKSEMIESLILSKSSTKLNQAILSNDLINTNEKLNNILNNQIPDSWFKSSNIKSSRSKDKDDKNIEHPINGREKPRNGNSKIWVWITMVAIIGFCFWKRTKIKPFLFFLYESISNINLKKEKKSYSEQVDNITETPKVSQDTISNKDLENIFTLILQDSRYLQAFNRFVLTNEQLCNLWVKNSLKYPEIKQILLNELSQKQTNQTTFSDIKEQQKDIPIFEKKIQNQKSVLYADSIFNGFFNNVNEKPNEETVFELHLQNEQYASFKIYDLAKHRIIANPAFLEGCDKQVVNINQKIEIVSEGTTQLQPDGKWKINKKLNVTIT